jgi:hypothetical protein
VIWKAKEEDRIKQAIIDREVAVKTRDRLSRSVSEFLNRLLNFQKRKIVLTWDRCYDFLNILAEKFSEKIGVFASKQS